jgi:hypothetical protein
MCSAIRIAFIGTMMKAVLERAFGAEGKALEKILGTVVTGLNQKLLLLHFDDAKAEHGFALGLRQTGFFAPGTPSGNWQFVP